MAKPLRLTANYEKNVFINCPFDDEYKPLFYAIVFAVNDLGFDAKGAKDESNAGKSRIEKIQDLIAECKFSIHDISRVDLDPVNNLPRFNMPFELGLDLGCRQYGKSYQRRKVIWCWKRNSTATRSTFPIWQAVIQLLITIARKK